MTSYNYQLLEVARQLRKKTQKEVAEEIGISQGNLSKAEHLIKVLPDDVMDKLSRYYDLPLSFFTQEEGLSPVGHFYYRKKLSIPEKDIDAFVAKIRIYKSIIDTVFSNIELPCYNLTSYTPDEFMSAKEIAQKIRYELRIFRGPVPNLTTLLENNGIIVMKFDFGSDKIDGLASITDQGRKVIFINDAMPNDRIRFSLAHELGHMIMHIENPPKDFEAAEREANEFASEFLMPEEELRPILATLSLSDLILLKRRWRVSMHALVRRAKDLEVISQERYRFFQITFSRKGFTKNEPEPLPGEKPIIWDETIQLYKSELKYTDTELMELMRINESDYRQWFSKEPRIVKLAFR